MTRMTQMVSVFLAPRLWVACSATAEGIALDGKPQSSTGGAGGSASESSTGGNISIGDTGGNGSGNGPGPCMSTDDNDWDKDGVTKLAGDCNDCNPSVGPNAIELPTDKDAEAVDEDCDGDIDEDDVYVPCDADLVIDESDAEAVAKAVGLCKRSSGADDWGLVSARWSLPDGSDPPVSPSYDLGHGVLPDFGPNVKVREGARMLVLSSGTARRPNDQGYEDPNGFDKMITAQHPAGFPKESPACPGVTTGAPHDAAALEVTLRTPANAKGLAFDFNFYTYEWPDFVCSEFNDFFVALLSPPPAKQSDANISFDSQNNPVSVNNAFVEVCGCEGNPPGPCMAGGKVFGCNLGNVELIGTGFGFDTTSMGDHAATSWLETRAPVEPNSEVTLRWAVYDSGDGVLDSTTLIDNFRWLTEAGTTSQTQPVPK